jgi:uroporphyrinogen decarboxylase
MTGYRFPNPLDPRFFSEIPARIDQFPDRFRVFQIGFSLYERGWTLRGMENLLMDFYDHPAFVQELFEAIADYNIAQVREAVRYDIDAVYFGDDWGQQRGLQMGPSLWRQRILPQLRRMYGAVREAGKYVMIHSDGDVDELFDDLIDAGVSCYNPFQPEVMDVDRLLPSYRGRLCFHGGLSTQRTLPFGTPEQVSSEVRRLLALGSQGGYIFAASHDVEGDVPLANMLAMIETVQSQTLL